MKEYTHSKKFGVIEIEQNPTLTLALHTIDLGKQALVFVASKASAEKVAETIAKKVPKGNDAIQKMAEKALHALSKPTKQCERLTKCLSHGIAFHHSGLVAAQREIIEDGFREGTVKIIACTPTLAAGVDLPAFRTILKDLKRYAGNWGMQWIPVLEYQQMCGRAGRPGMEDYGEAIAIASSEGEFDEIYSRYLLGKPENIYSKLAVEPVLRTYLLSLIVSGIVRDVEGIFRFFEKTFWAHQYQDMSRLKMIISKVLNLLEEYEFIIKDEEKNTTKKNDFASADTLLKSNSAVVRATVLGTRVSQLYIDPYTAHQMICALRRSPKATLEEFSFLQMVCYTLEMRPLLKVKAKEYDAIMETLQRKTDTLITLEPTLYDPEYDEFLNSVKTSSMLYDWINEKDEEFLMATYDVRPGELHAKLENADWLLHGTEEISRLMGFPQLATAVSKLRFRLEYGAKEELFALLKLRNIGRVRARKLYSNGIRDIGVLKATDIGTLSQLLGKALAIDIKKQIGEDVIEEPVPEGKRKGQISLMDYHEQ